MAAAPHFSGSAELTYKPQAIKGLRLGLECRRVGKYYMDNLNQHIYKGYTVANIRAGYEISHYEIWVNALNVFDKYYSVLSAYAPDSGYAYQLGDPRLFTLGVSFRFGK